jgi:lipopolysaccharide/colanic/teichoic acid biosynthesis glycosyltransferase
MERLLDWVAVVVGASLPFAIEAVGHGHQRTAVSNAVVAEAAGLLGLMVVLLLERHGEYRPYLSLLAVRETERFLRVGAECCLVVLPFLWLAAPSVPKTLVFSGLLTVPVVLVLEKAGWRIILRVSGSAGYTRQKAVILGGGPMAKNIYSVLLRSPKLGIDPVAIVDEEAATNGTQFRPNSYWCERSAMVLAGPLSPALFRNLNASSLIIADSTLNNAEILQISSRAASVGISTYIVSRDYLEPDQSLEYCEVDGIMLAGPATERQDRFSELAKRLIDILLAGLGLLLLALPCALAAMLIRQGSPGPAIFRQVRVGYRGRLFYLYKFRTMFVDSPAYAFSPTSGLDTRVTPIGRCLRRTCFDEVPQLWNVLRGDMSLVGPRPEMQFIVERYNRLQRRRLSVKPGLTGLWQLSGDRSRLIHENLEYDMYYFHDFRVETRIVRFHNVYGPLGTYEGGKEKAPAAISRKVALTPHGGEIEVWGDGQQTRSFMYIDDCVEGLLRLMASSYRDPLNLGTDELISVDGLVDLVCEIAGKKLVKIHDLKKPQGVRGRNSDNSRLRQVLGWEPRIFLGDGLKVTYLWIEHQLRKSKRLPPAFAYAAD